MKVRISKGGTFNLGNFQNMKVEVEVELDVDVDKVTEAVYDMGDILDAILLDETINALQVMPYASRQVMLTALTLTEAYDERVIREAEDERARNLTHNVPVDAILLPDDFFDGPEIHDDTPSEAEMRARGAELDAKHGYDDDYNSDPPPDEIGNDSSLDEEDF